MRQILSAALAQACLSRVAAGYGAARAAAEALPVTTTPDEDDKNMMDQLGIEVLRSGPNGDEKAPNHPKYDELMVNASPDFPNRLSRLQDST